MDKYVYAICITLFSVLFIGNAQTSFSHNTLKSLQQTKQFTIENGLPSNRIYQTAEDKYGTLWIATDNGVSRFDGKFFSIYTIQDGLLGNDVVHIESDSSGVIWVNSYLGGITYFEEKENKFKIPTGTTKAMLEDWKVNVGEFIKLSNNNLLYINHNSTNYLTGSKISTSTLPYYSLPQYYNQFFKGLQVITSNKSKQALLCLRYKGVVVDSLSLDTSILTYRNSNAIVATYCIPNATYCNTKNKLVKFYDVNANPFSYKVACKPIHSACYTYTYHNKWICISHIDGSVSILNDSLFEFVKTLKGNFIANRGMLDKYGNCWISSNGQGLIKFDKPIVQILNKNFSTLNFYSSLSFDTIKQKLFVGTADGKVYASYNNDKSTSMLYEDLSKSYPILKIIHQKNRLIAVSYNKVIVHEAGKTQTFSDRRIGIKNAIELNENELLIAGINKPTNLCVFNLKHKLFNLIQTPSIKRLNCLLKISDSTVVLGASNGLYMFNLLTKKFVRFSDESYNVTDIIHTNGLLWVTTSSNGLLVFKHQILVKQITIFSDYLVSLNCCKQVCANKMLVGSNLGVYCIQFQIKNNILTYEIEKSKTLHFLHKTNITCIEVASDSFVYISTNENLYKVNLKEKSISDKINLLVTNIKINNRDTAIQTSYSLPTGKKSIEVSVLAASLTEDCNEIVYAINDTSVWKPLQSNKLLLEVEGGQTMVYIKANGYTYHNQSNILALSFDIESPFYKQPFFWLGISFSIIALAFSVYLYYVYRKKMIIQAQQNALQMQRQQLTADLHDDIGSSLSSLQLNTTFAANLMDSDINKAKQMMIKVENQCSKLAEKVSDFIWSMKPNDESLMTLSSRMTNYCFEIIGATQIKPHIHIDKAIDAVDDVTIRKNILLITKEALNNTAKYSEANHVWIDMRIKNKIIYIEIKDDGIGLVHAKRGNGLTNMEFRAKEMNGTFELTSKPKQGVLVKVSVAL